jgi:hypothetical protein
MDTSFIRINGNQRAGFNVGGNAPQSGYDRRGGGVWEHIAGADLDNAWFPCAGSGKNRAEVEVVGKHRVTMSACVVHYFGIGRVWRAKGRPMDSLKTACGKNICPAGGQIHVDE